MRARVVGVVALLGLVGLGSGYAAAANFGEPTSRLAGATAPVPASSPSVPAAATGSVRPLGPSASSNPSPPEGPTTPGQTGRPSAIPYAEDVAFPALRPGLDYVERAVGPPTDRWRHLAPRGWETRNISDQEQSWFPPGTPVGGYAVRVKVLDTNATPEELVVGRLTALRSGYEDVIVRERTEATLAITFRSQPENWLRFNTFRWLTAPDGTRAALEIAVNGRRQDRDGLAALLDRVSGSAAVGEEAG